MQGAKVRLELALDEYKNGSYPAHEGKSMRP
jgi:hypothetical protein